MKDLRLKREGLMAQLDEMVSAVETEVRSLNADEIAKFNEVKAEIENIDATIAMVEEKRAKEMGKEKELVEKRSADELEQRALDMFFRGYDLGAEERAMLTTTGQNQATIPTTIAKGILKKLEEMCPILEKAKRFSSKGTLRLINETSYGDAGLTAESATFKDADAVLNFIELKSWKITASTKVSFEMLQNSEVDLNQYLTDVIVRRLAREVNKYLVTGTGTTQPQGLVNGTQECEISKDLSINDFVLMQTTCHPSFLDNAMWIMNRKTFQHVASSLIDGLGRPMLTTHVINDKVEYRLLGLPIVVDMHMADIGDTGTKPVILANVAEGYSINMLQNITVRHLTEVGFTEGTETFAGYIMLDGKISNQDAIVVGKIKDASRAKAGK